MERPRHLTLVPPIEISGKMEISRHDKAVAFKNKLRIRAFSTLTLDQANAIWSAIGSNSVDEAVSRSRMSEGDFRESFATGRVELAERYPFYQKLLSSTRTP